MWEAVLSHSRERTKGRPVAAKSRQHHGCPRTPPRLAWGRSLLLCEANCFLAGAARNALRCLPVVRWRPGGTGGPPSLRASWWAFGCACRARSSFAHRQMCGVFFPTRGKEPKGDRWQPNRDSTMAAPGPLLAWLEGGTSCCARLIASSRGRHEGIGVLRCSSAGGRAAPVGHPRCARVGGPVGRVTACRLAWRDRSETVRFSAAVHGRRSWSSLRRPPQEVAASLDHGGAHNPHAKRGDRRGAPPERNHPSPLPRRGRCHGSCRDG